ncbi:MAG: type II toxin-antitoxin system VapC family toxin [Microscillaceae bacterium]|nr:type II toxin-antitoxin system VapC family toxin [Microscillaceae bacterium]
MNQNTHILDTNILVLFVKNANFSQYFKAIYLDDSAKRVAVSIVSIGELDSIILQNEWGQKKIYQLNTILKNLDVISINNQAQVQAYSVLDAFSQGKLKNNPLPSGMTARNMGKNDLWIAATAYAISATLITTDKDFAHLDPQFITVDCIDIQRFK